MSNYYNIINDSYRSIYLCLLCRLWMTEHVVFRSCLYIVYLYVQSFTSLCFLIISHLLFLFLRYFQPFQLFIGATVVTLMFVGFVWAAETQASIRHFRRNHPLFTVLAILLASYLFISVLGGVAVFLFGITFPVFSKTTYMHHIHNWTHTHTQSKWINGMKKYQKFWTVCKNTAGKQVLHMNCILNNISYLSYSSATVLVWFAKAYRKDLVAWHSTIYRSHRKHNKGQT